MSKLVVAVLETMWDWRSMTSSAGYNEAPPYFTINPYNHTGGRLYWFVGKDVRLLVTNACRELVSSPNEHGKPNPEWLKENLAKLDAIGPVGLLLVCGKVAQSTYLKCGYKLYQARVKAIPHPAARSWTREQLDATRADIQKILRRIK